MVIGSNIYVRETIYSTTYFPSFLSKAVYFYLLSKKQERI